MQRRAAMGGGQEVVFEDWWRNLSSEDGAGVGLHKQEPARKTDRHLFLKKDKILEKISSQILVV